MTRKEAINTISEFMLFKQKDGTMVIDLMRSLEEDAPHCGTCQCGHYLTHTGWSLPLDATTDPIKFNRDALIEYVNSNPSKLIRERV